MIPRRREYGVRREGGHIEAKVSMHVATREVEERQAAGEKNVWLVQREVDDWRKPEDLKPNQWCPVCKDYHADPIGEQTDVGVYTRACPRYPTDNPRYYGSPIYTGDR